MKSLLIMAVAVSTSISVYASGPDSSKVKLSTTKMVLIQEPEEWGNPKSVSLEDEKAIEVFKQRLARIWKKHSSQWLKEKEEEEGSFN